MLEQRYHLFFSVKQAESISRIRKGDIYYKREDGAIVKVSQADVVVEGESIPRSNWDDANYLGIGVYYSGSSTSLIACIE